MAECGQHVRAQPVYAGIETGGTLVVCVIGTGADDIRAGMGDPDHDARSRLWRLDP